MHERTNLHLPISIQLPFTNENKYIYFWDDGCFVVLLCFDLTTKPWSCSQFPFLGLPSWSWYTKGTCLLKSSLCICSSDAPWSRVTEGSDWSPFAWRPICLYHLRDGTSLSPVLPVFLSTVRAGRSQTGWRWKRRLCTSSAYKSPDSPLFADPRHRLALAGLSILHAAALLTLVLPGGRGRPSGRRAPTNSPRAGWGASALPQRLSATLPESCSRLCELWAPVLARVGSVPGPCPHAPAAAVAGASLLGAPLPRTPARRFSLLSAELCSASPRHGRPASAVDAATACITPSASQTLSLRGAAKPQRRQGRRTHPALPQPDQRRGGRFDSLYRKVVPEEVEVEIGEPLAAFLPCPSALSAPTIPSSADPRPPATFGLPDSPQNAYCCPPCPGTVQALGELDKPI